MAKAKQLYQVIVDGHPLPLAARLCREQQQYEPDGTKTDRANADAIAVMLDHRRVEVREVSPRPPR